MTDMTSSHNWGDAPDDKHPAGESGGFWGWRMVMAGTAILIVSSGIGFYGHGVILDPLRNAHHWSKSAVSLAVTLYFFASGAVQLLIGMWIDRYGPRLLLVIGSIIFCVAFILLSGIKQLWHLYAVYLLMSVGWCCTSLVPVNTLIANWFIRRRGLAMSVTMTGLSIGGIIVVPLASWAIIKWGLEAALPALGVVYALVVIPVAVGVVKARPDDVGQCPDGRLIHSCAQGEVDSALGLASQTRLWTRREAATTAAFWAIVIAFLLAMCGQMSFLVHQMSFLSQYLGVTGAAGAVSLTASASIIGRLAMGAVVDRLNKRMTAAGFFLAQGAAVLALAFNQHAATLYLGTFVFGLTMGNIIMVQSLIIGECFGMVSFGTVYGMVGLFSMTGAAMGPWMAGAVFDATGSYQHAFVIFAGFAVLAAIAIVFARPQKSSTRRTKPLTY